MGSEGWKGAKDCEDSGERETRCGRGNSMELEATCTGVLRIAKDSVLDVPPTWHVLPSLIIKLLSCHSCSPPTSLEDRAPSPQKSCHAH